MSTLLLADQRQNTSIHPPDTEDREILTIPDPTDRRRLAPADRLSLRIGLWLLQRSLREPAAPSRTMEDHRRRALSEHEALTLLTFDLQRRIL